MKKVKTYNGKPIKEIHAEVKEFLRLSREKAKLPKILQFAREYYEFQIKQKRLVDIFLTFPGEQIPW